MNDDRDVNMEPEQYAREEHGPIWCEECGERIDPDAGCECCLHCCQECCLESRYEEYPRINTEEI